MRMRTEFIWLRMRALVNTDTLLLCLQNDQILTSCSEMVYSSLKRKELFIPGIHRVHSAMLFYDLTQFVYVTSLEYIETGANHGLPMNVI
jgi:hypothetical protein